MGKFNLAVARVVLYTGLGKICSSEAHQEGTYIKRSVSDKVDFVAS